MRFAALNILAAMLLTGCSHHEIDEDYCLRPGYEAELKVQLSIDRSLFDHATVEARSDNGMLPRFTVWAFRAGETEPMATAVTLGNEVGFTLPVGKYRVVAFGDYVPESRNSDDWYFFTDQVEELLLMEKYGYKGNDGYKQAYWSSADINVGYKNKPVALTLCSLMSKIEIVATDTPDYEVGKVKVSYPELLPAAVHGLTGEISYAWTGVLFESVPTDSVLAFDHVYAPSAPDSLALRIEIYDKSDSLMARKSRIKVPVARRGITTVRGPFYGIFEKDSVPDKPDEPPMSGGAGINPGFSSTVLFPI